ncbi:DUF2919 family protein [Paraferrimonas sp. SM1919]|uniref:DUF2919 family protein n=1 Tax=Paraferrimonas sp. SM1919 TaxID=2662263 RepID=UPI0013D60B30|nr:DUF2919 family protein [Paraferrimonas sp. SM1919]
MAKNSIENVAWLDDKAHVKPPIWLYLMIAFLAKGYLAWLASLTLSNDRSLILSILYPNKDLFFNSLITGSLGLLAYLLVLLERKRKWTFAIGLFSYLKWILIAGLSLESYQFIQLFIAKHGQFSPWLGLSLIGVFWGFWYLVKTKHLNAYIKDWHKDSES